MNEIRIRKDLPEAFEILDPVWIPMPDGKRLAARILLPRSSEELPVPAVLEYIPYRRRDGTISRDRLTHAYFAGHGYAAVRVDMRGAGDSDGLLLDEYLAAGAGRRGRGHRLARRAALVQRHGRHDGHLLGRLQRAAGREPRPPALKAIITVCSTDDRYADDCHYMGGCLLDKSRLGLDHVRLRRAAAGPAGGRRALARDVAGAARKQPAPGRNGSSTSTATNTGNRARSARIMPPSTAAVYAVGGWADGYTNAMLAAARRLRAPEKGADRPVGPCLSA